VNLHAMTMAEITYTTPKLFKGRRLILFREALQKPARNQNKAGTSNFSFTTRRSGT
jgi:hypothetical protein